MASPTRAAAILLRRYEEAECGTDGYPLAWRRPAGPYLPRIPELVRAIAGHRCERCGHPYLTRRETERPLADTEGWSPCDERCHHGGVVRWKAKKKGQEIVGGEQEADAIAITELLSVGAIADVEALWRVLTVHHLTGEKADCRWWNLAALCQRCHLQVQGRVKMHQVYGLEHTPWFRPHAAGYYAATYLGEDITRGQARERQDELLALERVA
jgi:hypothetical protein